jgi:hypothetical protein
MALVTVIIARANSLAGTVKPAYVISTSYEYTEA